MIRTFISFLAVIAAIFNISFLVFYFVTEKIVINQEIIKCEETCGGEATVIWDKAKLFCVCRDEIFDPVLLEAAKD